MVEDLTFVPKSRVSGFYCLVIARIALLVFNQLMGMSEIPLFLFEVRDGSLNWDVTDCSLPRSVND